MKPFEDYIGLATTMSQQTSTRLDIFTQMENMYGLKPQNMPTADWIKPTASPDVRNAIIGGARMLSASDPKWSVTLAADQEAEANKLELFAEHTWAGAGLVSRKPIHFTAALSAMLYGEIHMRVKLVSDMLTLASPTRKPRLEQTALRTPALFECLNPKLCSVLKDDTGLVAHLLKRKMLVAEARAFGKDAEDQLAGRKVNDTITVLELYDEEQHAVWMEGSSKPFIFAPVTNGIIPVVYADIEGGDLFNLDTDVDATQPFGYGVYKSGFWDRQNLIHTLAYSLFFAIGSNPLFTEENADPDSESIIDDSTPGQIIKTKGRLRQLFTNVFTQDFQNLLSIADAKVTESTLYRTAMGESPGSGAPYSLAALLSANGRQALIPYERMTEHACTMAMTTAAQMLKAAGGTLKLKSKDGALDFNPKTDIPDSLVIEARLEIDLPIDESRNVQMAAQLTAGEHPLASHAHVREKLLGIGQSSEEDKRLIAERYAWMKAQTVMQAKAQAEMQQIMGQAQPQGQPMPQGEAPQGGQLPPDMQALQAQAMQDEQMGQPMPPEQMAGQEFTGG